MLQAWGLDMFWICYQLVLITTGVNTNYYTPLSFRGLIVKCFFHSMARKRGWGGYLEGSDEKRIEFFFPFKSLISIFKEAIDDFHFLWSFLYSDRYGLIHHFHYGSVTPWPRVLVNWIEMISRWPQRNLHFVRSSLPILCYF